jgi:two-component SAPR family response regulator
MMLIYAIDDEPNMLYLLHEAIAEAAPEAVIEDYRLGTAAVEHMEQSGARPDVIFTDIRMPGLSGLELAAGVRKLSPDTKLVFVTGYNYAMDAYQLHVQGYIPKPVEAERVREELENLFPDAARPGKIRVQCFGNFEVFWDNQPIPFARKKTKELFAFLVDRCGALCSTGDILAALWEETEESKSAKHRVWNLTGDMRTCLTAIGMEEVLISRGQQLAIRPELLDCDYYRALAGDPAARERFIGEYMEQYSWAESTKGGLAFRFIR